MTERTKADVAILIALQEEYDYFSKVFKAQPADGRFWFDFTDLSHTKRSAAVCVIGKMGNEDARVAADKAIDALQPTLVVVIGLAGMMSSDARLGEIVVATEVANYAYSSKIVDQGETFEINWGGRSFMASSHLTHLASSFRMQRKPLFDRWKKSAIRYLEEVLPAKDREKLAKEGLLPPKQLLHVGPIVSGDPVIASINYKKKLLEQNRKLLAVEMESAGALAAAYDRETWPATMVIRALSDPADPRKKTIDDIGGGNAIRRWAMYNAASLLKIFLQELPVWSTRGAQATVAAPAMTEELIATVHQEISLEHLPLLYRERPSNETLDHMGAYFRLVAQEGDLNRAPFWKTIADFVVNNKNPFPLWINGEPGTGKSSLLATLYWYLYAALEENPKSAPVPVYVNVQFFDELGWDDTGDRKVPEEFSAAIRDALQPIIRIAHKGHSVILLVDGLDEDGRFRDTAERVLFDLDITGVKKIVSVVRGFSKSAKVPPELLEAESVVQLRPIRTDSQEAPRVVDTFCQVTGAGPQQLTQHITRLGVDSIDIATLAMINRSLTRPGYKDVTTLSDLYIRWVEYERRRADTTGTLLSAARMAYDYTFEERLFDGTDKGQMADWKLIRTHTNVRHCLIAWLIIRCVTDKTIEDRAQLLARVFVFTINRFCKELMNTPQNSQKVLDGIKTLTATVELTARTCLAYLAGRFEDQALRDSAEKLLREWISKQLPPHPQTPREELMFIRTCYVGLAKYGDNDATNRYVRLMMKHRDLDDLNRGFHLQYYGDVPNYEPSVASAYHDALGPFPKTAERLKQKLRDGLDHLPSESLEIEIHTLCSLAQHRHVSGKLDDALREEIRDLMRRILESKLIDTAELRAFVQMVDQNLANSTFSPVTPLERMFELKALPRSGWRHRKVRLPIESVASHSFGAYLIGLFFLPQTIADTPEYDKQRVLQMVLVHDLAEAWTGDLLPWEKSDDARREERKWFEYLGLLGTYQGVGDVASVEHLWEDFEERKSINGCLAKDLDKLDNLMQLQIYRKHGAAIHDAQKWLNDIVSAVQTVEGKRILRLINEHFERSSIPDQQSLWLRGGPRLKVTKPAPGQSATGQKRPRKTPSKRTAPEKR